MSTSNYQGTTAYQVYGTRQCTPPKGVAGEGFPALASAKELNSDTYPALVGRQARKSIKGLDGQPLAFFYDNGKPIFICLVEGQAILELPGSTGTTSVLLGTCKVSDRALRVMRYGREIYLPDLRICVDLDTRRIRHFSHELTNGSGAYSMDAEPVTELTLTFSSDVSQYQVGDIVTVKVSYTEGTEKEDSYFATIRRVDPAAKQLVFSGDIPVEEEYTTGTFRVLREFPEAAFLTMAKKRLWALSSEGALSASVKHLAFSFAAADGLSEEYAPATLFPCDGETPMAFCTLSDAPVILTDRSVIRILGSSAGAFRAERYEKYGVGAGLEGTVTVSGNSLYFCSAAGICQFRSGKSELLLPLTLSAGAVGAVFRDHYLIFDGASTLYDYDLQSGALHHEAMTSMQVFGITPDGNGALAYTQHTTQKEAVLCLVRGALSAETAQILQNDASFHITDEASPAWEVEFCPFTLKNGGFAARGVTVEAETPSTSEVRVFVGFDGEAPTEIGSVTAGQSRADYFFPLLPVRHERMTISLQGTGTAKVFGASVMARDA